MTRRAAVSLVPLAGVLALIGCVTSAAPDGSVTVTEVNASAPQSAQVGDTVLLTASVVAEGDPASVRFEWYQTFGRVVTLSSRTGQEVSFVAPSLAAKGTLRFRVDAVSPDGTIHSSEVAVAVEPDGAIDPNDATDGDTELRPRVRLVTSKGDIYVELDRLAAPVTVRNFLRYVDDGFYEDTIFHRVIADFVIQGGGLTEDLEEKETRPPIINEASNGLRNDRGTVAMARTNDPDSATSQFFINLVNNDSLNPRSGSAGYTVFGRVVAGMSVVDEIGEVETESRNGFSDVPVDPIFLRRVDRLAPDEPVPDEEP